MSGIPAAPSEERQPTNRMLTLRGPGSLSLRLHARRILVGTVACGMLIVIGLVALSLGSVRVAVPDIVAAVFGTSSDAIRMVVVEWRMPRVLLAGVFGACLGVSGAIFQSLTRNALGSPDVIGFNMGSFTGVLVVMLLGGTGFWMIATGALGSGLLTAFATYVFAFKKGMDGFRLIIVGIAVSAMLASVNTWILVKADIALAMSAAVWGAGTLNGVDWSQVRPALVVLVPLVILLTIVAPRIRQLELGDEIAALQGLDVERSKVITIALGVAFTAVVTAVAGPISFVALAAPQVARRLTRTGASIDLVTSALVGGVLLSAADLIAQHGVPGVSLPVGAVTVSIGGLYLVWLLARETRTRS